MKHTVTVRIPAVLELQGTVEAESPAGAVSTAKAQARRIAEDFTDSPVLQGRWPEQFGNALVTATTLEDGEAEVELA